MGSDSFSLSHQPTSPSEITFKSQSISSNRIILSTGDNLPHTAHPILINFCGVVSPQNPLIIDSIKFFEGGSGGNFDGKSEISKFPSFKFPSFFFSLILLIFFP